MPDSARKTEESEVRTVSVGILVKSDQSLSFASCPTCPGPNRTPILHAKCTPVDSASQAGKDTDGEVDAGVMGKVNAASSSSSSSNASEKKEKLSSASYPFSTFHRKFHCMSLGVSGKERDTIIRRALDEPARDITSAHLEVAAASPNASPASPVVKGKRKADDSKNRPESSATKTNRGKAATSEAEKAYKHFWQHREQEILRDPPGSSGRLGPCMQILALDATEPINMHLLNTVETQGASLFVPPFISFQTAGFSLDFTSPARGTILPCMDEHLIRDSDRVGSESLNVFLRANIGEGPTFMDQ